LLNLPIASLTFEKVESLRAELKEREKDLRTLKATAECAIWLRDLEAVSEELDAIDERRAQDAAAEIKAKRPAKPAASRKRAPKGRTAATDDAFSPMKASPAPKKRTKAAAPAKPKAAPKAAPAKKAPPAKKAAPAKPKRVITLDDDDDDDASEEETVVVEARKTPRPTRAARSRAAAPVNYADVIEISDDSDEEDEDEDEYDDESDF